MHAALAAFVAQRKDLVDGLHVFAEGDPAAAGQFPHAVLGLVLTGQVLHRGPIPYTLTETIRTAATSAAQMTGAAFAGVESGLRRAIEAAPAWYESDATSYDGPAILTQQLTRSQIVRETPRSRPMFVLTWTGLLSLGRLA